MSSNRKEGLIKLCLKVGYFLLEQEIERVKSPLCVCQECIMVQIYSGDTGDTLRDLSGTEDSTQ